MGMPLQPSLIDPLLQDLSHSSRHYLSHFANHLCKDLVTYDMPDLNPFRNIIPLTSEHAVLLHISVANAAIHMANLCRASTTLLSLDGAQQLQPALSVNDQSTRFYRDALVAKHKAIQLLRHSLEHVDTVNRDVLLAAVLLFVNFDLVNSGKEDWKVHVEGARRLIEGFDLSGDDVKSSTMMGTLRDFVIADCLTYYILGSTVSFHQSRASASRHFQYILPLLKRTESNSYLSCPPMLLQIMLSASYLCGIDPAQALAEQIPLEEEASTLMQRAQSFDVHAWAQVVQCVTTYEDFESRVHVASAHKSAIRLYIHRAVPSARLLDGAAVEGLVCDIVHHLSCIDCNDNLIKGTSWPTFVAGAESEDPARRAWAADRLRLLWRQMPWGYLSTALETLQVIWGMGALADGAPDASPVGWLQKLKKLGIEWIIV
ncbi:putative acriflavine sensitivity control protein acr-2 protein [Neofusicoccum parvum UCRNP2]|uniref:Putative acriflavine sensitivity control protein acr-2 protein n=1 Tax=Botryosphaeria parva (strain UCR-NP2) TaxID=1287680 RepID=R1GA48_BOTPV|nr:putative acriflavine sensitivity control protein acr-2 protein [Neofusicoccum parvum UCRNP2]